MDTFLSSPKRLIELHGCLWYYYKVDVIVICVVSLSQNLILLLIADFKEMDHIYT